MTEIRVDDATLDMTEDGSGEPLVLVHGSASDRRTWNGVRDELAAGFRTFSYSRRYHWPNAAIPGGADYAMTEQVDDLEAVIARVAAGPVHLVGHSYGAFLCLLLAIRAPHRVRSMVLLEPPVLPLLIGAPPSPARLLALLVRRPVAGWTVARFIGGGVVPATLAARRGDIATSIRRFGSAVLGKEAFRNLSAERLAQLDANFMKAELLGSGFAPLDAADVRTVRRPTLLVGAARSPAVFGVLLDALEALLPNAERVEIEAASHNIHEDAPDAFLAATLAFLRRHAR